MRFPKLFFNDKSILKYTEKLERKSFSPLDSYWDFGNLYDYFTHSQNYLITKILAVSYYTKCSPIYNAVDLIATAISNLIPKVFDTEKEIWVTNHPVLDLLKLPNADITWNEFVYAIVSFYLVTGDSFIIGSGNPMSPPKELYVYPSTGVTVLPGNDGFVQSLRTTLYWGYDTFERNEINKRFRYFNPTKTSEIWHIKHFNPTTIQSNVYGMSPLNPIYFEINEHQNANRHNLSILTRGATPSGIMNINPPIDHNSFIRMQEQFNKEFAGATNAGRVILVNGFGEFKSNTMTNKDMDFLELKKDVEHAMYRTLKIPLALISTETMTLDNMSRAMLLFYDLAVLPLANRIFNELSNFLMPRYGKQDNLILSFDEGEIISLEPRRNDQLKVLKDLGIFTINQLRAINGADPLQGGNAIYGLASQIPIATDLNDASIAKVYDDLPALDDVGGNEERLGAKKTSRAKFTEILKSKIDKDGNRLFSDEDINKIADKHGLE